MRHSKAVMEQSNIDAQIRQANEALGGLEVLLHCASIVQYLQEPMADGIDIFQQFRTSSKHWEKNTK